MDKKLTDEDKFFLAIFSPIFLLALIMMSVGIISEITRTQTKSFVMAQVIKVQLQEAKKANGYAPTQILTIQILDGEHASKIMTHRLRVSECGKVNLRQAKRIELVNTTNKFSNNTSLNYTRSFCS